jgi:hypothetical protein
MIGTQARRSLRILTGAVAALATIGGVLVATGASAGASEFNGDGCTAVGALAAGPTPLYISWSNPSFVPCESDHHALLVAKTFVVVPGLIATKATVGGVTSSTNDFYDYYGNHVVTATADIASLTVFGPGLLVRATGIHSDSTVVCGDGCYSYANSWVATLSVNGVAVKVLKNTPITIPLGLRTAILINQRTVDYQDAYASPLHITFPDYRYGLFLAGTSVAESPLT